MPPLSPYQRDHGSPEPALWVLPWPLWVWSGPVQFGQDGGATGTLFTEPFLSYEKKLRDLGLCVGSV